MVNITARFNTRTQTMYIRAYFCAEKTKALLFQGANPTMDTSRVLGLAVHIPQHGIQNYTIAEGATNGPTCASQQQGLFTPGGGLSAFPGTNGITSPNVAAGTGSQASGGQRHLGLLSHFTSSQNAAQGRVQCQRRSGGRQACCGCRQQCMVGMQQCDHCEKSVCGDCYRRCCVCQTLFCPFCSVLK